MVVIRLSKKHLQYENSIPYKLTSNIIKCKECSSEKIRSDGFVVKVNNGLTEIAVMLTCLNCGLRSYPDWAKSYLEIEGIVEL